MKCLSRGFNIPPVPLFSGYVTLWLWVDDDVLTDLQDTYISYISYTHIGCGYMYRIYILAVPGTAVNVMNHPPSGSRAF